VDLRDLAALPDDTPGVVHAAFAEIVCDLDGGDAGMEILNLRHLCRAVLGETRARPEELVGVPCRADGCGLRALARAEPPSDPSDAGHYSECMACGDKMDDAAYGDWVALCAAYERHRVKVPATLENLPGVA
jgi:tRNA U54 and U55 pseudouridine synthase Pus10